MHKQKNTQTRFHFFAMISIALFLCYAVSAFQPADRAVWWVEMSSVFAVHLLLIALYPKFQFSSISYFIVSLWLLLHSIGAHYTFEHVPFGWVTELFGFERNHFDRLAHFVIGLNAYLIAEYLFRQKHVTSLKTAAFFGIVCIVAMAALWEIAEWLYAAFDGGNTGLAFLGSQGDIWDAQKDILADTLGALLAAVGFVFFPPKVLSRR